MNTRIHFVVGQFAIAGSVCVCGLGGCSRPFASAELVYAAAEMSQHDDATPLMRRESGLEVGDLVEEGELPAEVFWLSPDRVAIFRRNEQGETDRIERSVTQIGGDRRIVLTNTRTGETVGSTLIRQEPGMGVVILENQTEDIESDFRPYALLAPETLAAGESLEVPFELTTSGRVLTSGDGKGKVLLKGLGTQDVRANGGVVRAFVIESEMSFSIGPAKITLSQRSWIDPEPGGLGLVAEESGDRVRVFGIPAHKASRVSVMERVEPAP